MIPRSFSLLFLTAALSASCCLAQDQDQDQHQIQKKPHLEPFIEKKPKLELQEIDVLDIASEGESTMIIPPINLPLNRNLELKVYHTVHHNDNSIYKNTLPHGEEQVPLDLNAKSPDPHIVTVYDDDEEVIDRKVSTSLI
jgi:hypothetical protein